MCRCLRVSRSGYYAWTGRRPSRSARRRKELGALIEWVFNSSRGAYRYRRTHAALARRGVETSPDTVRSIMREQGLEAAQPRRKDPAPPSRPPDLGSRPDLVRRDFTANRPGEQVGGRYHVYPYLGGVRVPGGRPRLLHEESSRVRDWGDNMRTESVVRGDRYGGPQVPVHDRRDDPPAPGRGCQYTSEQLGDHLESYGTRPSVGRTGVCWAGAWAEVGGCDPQGTRGSIRWCIPQEARPSGILPPRSSWNTIRNDSTPPWGTGRRARSTRSTEQ